MKSGDASMAALACILTLVLITIQDKFGTLAVFGLIVVLLFLGAGFIYQTCYRKDDE